MSRIVIAWPRIGSGLDSDEFHRKPRGLVPSRQTVRSTAEQHAPESPNVGEDGAIAERYSLVEAPSKRYEQRTRWNVRDSDATLILALGELSGGSRLTADAARSAAKPLLVGRLDLYDTARAVAEFVEAHRVRTLNVAGPRESRCPGIHARAYALLRTVFADLERGRGLVVREGS